MFTIAVSVLLVPCRTKVVLKEVCRCSLSSYARVGLKTKWKATCILHKCPFLLYEDSGKVMGPGASGIKKFDTTPLKTSSCLPKR